MGEKNSLNEEFPPNDISEKKVAKVTTGKVVQKKKGLGSKMKETFLGDESADGVASYIIYDVIVPAAKNMISDTVTNGIEMLLFGKSRSSRMTRDKGKSHVSYSKYYQDDPRAPRQSGRGPSRPLMSRATHNFDDIILTERADAEQVIEELCDLIDTYDVASVNDFYELVGITGSFTDNKYGWDNLSTATVSRVREGYLITLPKTKVIE